MYKISSSWNRCWYTAHTFRTFIKIVFRQKDKLLQHHISSYRNNKNEKSEISMIIMKWFWMNHKCKANVAILISLCSPPYAHTIRGTRRRNNQTRMRTCDIKVSGCIVVSLIVIGCQNVFQLSWGGKTMANEKKKECDEAETDSMSNRAQCMRHAEINHASIGLRKLNDYMKCRLNSN